MSNAIRVSAVMGWVGLLLVPFLASGRGTPDSCWLRDASAPTPSTQYVLCEQGQVYMTKDNGGSWTMVQTGSSDIVLHAMAFLDAAHGIIVGDSGTILLTEDGSKTWKRIDSGSTEHLLALSTVGNQAWASGFDGVILHSEDGGRSWQQQKGGSGQGLEGIYFADADHGWAVGWAGTILRTADGGKSWREIKTDASSWSLSSVFFRDLKDGWAVGFGGELLRSRDGGTTWKALASPVANCLTSVALDHSGRVWIAADDQLLLSEDGGEKWRAVPFENNLFFCKLLPVNDSLWAIGQLGVMKQTGAGSEWTPLSSLVPAGVELTRIVSDNSGSAAVVGSK